MGSLSHGAERVAALVTVLLAALPLAASGDDPVALGRAFLENAQLSRGALGGRRIIEAAETIEALEASPALDLARLTLSFSMAENRQAALLRIGGLAGTPYADQIASATEMAAVSAGELGLSR